MTRTILFLILMHICCNLPVVVYNIYYTIQLEIAEEQSFIAVLPFIHSSTFYYVMNILYGSQSAINFFIYAFTNEHYKTAYIEFWNHLVCKEKRWYIIKIRWQWMTIQFNSSVGVDNTYFIDKGSIIYRCIRIVLWHGINEGSDPSSVLSFLISFQY